MSKASKMSKTSKAAKAFLCFRNDVSFLGNNTFAILNLTKFIFQVQRVLIFSNLILKNISRIFFFANLTKKVETAKTFEHQYH